MCPFEVFCVFVLFVCLFLSLFFLRSRYTAASQRTSPLIPIPQSHPPTPSY